MQRPQVENKELIVRELREALRSKETAFVYLYVKVTADSNKHVNISKRSALSIYAGFDDDTMTTATRAGCDIIIG